MNDLLIDGVHINMNWVAKYPKITEFITNAKTNNLFAGDNQEEKLKELHTIVFDKPKAKTK